MRIFFFLLNLHTLGFVVAQKTISTSLSDGTTTYGTITFTQNSTSSDTDFQLEFVNIPLNSDRVTINANLVTNSTGYIDCSLAGPVFNPFGISDSYVCNNNSLPSQCKVGDFSVRYGSIIGITNITASNTDSNLPLYGLSRIQGRSLVLLDNNSMPIACGNIGSPVQCSSSQYQAADRTQTSARDCRDLTICNIYSEYEITAPTTTSDRVCREVERDEQLVIRLNGISKSEFYDIEEDFTDGLASITSGIPKITRRAPVTSESRRRGANDVLDVFFGIFNPSSNSMVARSTVQTQLENQASQTASSCYTQSELDCLCTEDGDSGVVTIGINGCTDIDGQQRCFVAGGTDCTTATDANAYDAVAFPDAGSAFKTCPAAYPDRQNCLEKTLSLPVITDIDSISDAPEAASVDDIDIPDILTNDPTNDTLAFDFTGLSVDYLANFATFWRRLIGKGLPWDDVNYQVKLMIDGNGIDFSRAQSDGISYGIPYAVIVGISVLLLVFLPIIMCIVCCCRCCTCCCCHYCCGGQRVQNNPTNCGLFVNGFFVFAFAIVLLLFSIGIYLADEQMKSAINDSEGVALEAIDTAESYINGTLDQAEAVPSELLQLLRTSLFDVIDEINSDVSLQIQFVISNATNGALSSLRDLGTSVEATLTSLENIQAFTDALIANISDLDTAGQQLATDVAQLDTDCDAVVAAASPGRQPAIQPICDALGPYAWSIPADYNNVPSLSSYISDVQNVVDSDLQNLANVGESTFQEIPETLDNRTQEFKTMIGDELDNVENEINNQVSDIRSQANDIIYSDSGFSFEQTKQQISDVFDNDLLTMAQNYRAIASLAISVIFIILALMTLCALTVGCCIYEGPDEKLPTDRSTCSNCSGNCLIAIVVLLTIFLFFINLLLIILFPLGAVTGDVCDPIKSDAIFSELVDNKEVWGEYFLGAAIAGDGNEPITVGGILNSCRQNTALYSAAQIDKNQNLDLDQVFDLASQFNVSELLSGEINLDGVDLIPDDAQNELDTFRNLGLDAIDYQAFRDELNADLTSINLTAEATFFQDSITALEALQTADPIDPPSLGTFITDMQNALNQIISLEAQANDMNTYRQNQVAVVDTLEPAVENTTASINVFLNDVAGLDATFAAVTEDLIDVDEIDALAQETLDRFENITTDVVKNYIGKCQPISDIYDSLVQATCGEAQKGLDAFWISFAMVSFSSLFLLCFNIRLARYFRRMYEDDMVYDYDDDEYYDDDDEFELQTVGTPVPPEDNLPPPAYGDDGYRLHAQHATQF